VPYDSHGLQLLVKDLLSSISTFNAALDFAQALASAFLKSYKYLTQIRANFSKNDLSFTLGVITRWGTQLALISSVLKVRWVIQEFYDELSADVPEALAMLSQGVKTTQIWKNLKLMQAILEPISEAIMISEADSASIYYVIPRWKSIRLKVISLLREEAPSLINAVQTLFNAYF
jgi:hypothetical protein